MKDYYISFAIHLDPNQESFTGTAMPRWPAYINSQDGTFSVLQANQTSIGERPDANAAPHCDFWQVNSFVVRNQVGNTSLLR